MPSVDSVGLLPSPTQRQIVRKTQQISSFRYDFNAQFERGLEAILRGWA